MHDWLIVNVSSRINQQIPLRLINISIIRTKLNILKNQKPNHMAESIRIQSLRTTAPVQWQEKKCHHHQYNENQIARSQSSKINHQSGKRTDEVRTQRGKEQCKNQFECQRRDEDQKYARFQDINLLYNNGSSENGKKPEKIPRKYKPKSSNTQLPAKPIYCHARIHKDYDRQSHGKQTESTYTQANQQNDPIIAASNLPQKIDHPTHQSKQQATGHEIQFNSNALVCGEKIKKCSGMEQKQSNKNRHSNILQFEYNLRGYWIQQQDIAALSSKLQTIMHKIRTDINKNRVNVGECQEELLALRIVVLTQIRDRLRIRQVEGSSSHDNSKGQQKISRKYSKNKKYKSSCSHTDDNLLTVQRMLDSAIQQYATARYLRLQQLI